MTARAILHPFEGVEFSTPLGEGMVRFGDDLDAVTGVLGPDFIRTPGSSRITFGEGGVHVSIGDAGVEFIELATGDNDLAIELGGVDLAGLDAIECARHLRKVNGDAGVNEDEAPTSYVYAGLGVTVWQSHALQDALDALEAARNADEEPEEGIGSFEEETELARHFQAIGLASREYVKGYFA